MYLSLFSMAQVMIAQWERINVSVSLLHGSGHDSSVGE